MTLNVLLKVSGRFILLILLQVLLLNNISITEYGITPYFYILFILILPFDTPGWVLLLFGFILGLIIDMFCDTGGTHASATVLTAFLRPVVLKILSLRDGYAPESMPSVLYYGFLWFLKYSLILIFIHHITFYLMLEFSFANFFITFFQVLMTLLFTVFLVVTSQYLILRK